MVRSLFSGGGIGLRATAQSTGIMSKAKSWFSNFG